MNVIGVSTLDRATPALCTFSTEGIEKDGRHTVCLVAARRRRDGEIEGHYVYNSRHGWEWKGKNVWGEPLTDESVPEAVRVLLDATP